MSNLNQPVFYFSPPDFIAELIEEIKQAKTSIDIEIYIWEHDNLGAQIFKLLKDAQKRGVRVRLLLDGFGSYNFIQKYKETYRNTGIDIKIFNPLPRLGFIFLTLPYQIINFLGRLNRRNHRKIFIFDRETAFIGSFNITENALKWRETIVKIKNPDVLMLQELFSATWIWNHALSISGKRGFKYIRDKLRHSHTILTTQTQRLRLHFNRDFLKRLHIAKYRIWIMTPYLNPPQALIKSLTKAALRGVDVRLILPSQSDVPYLTWMTRVYYPPLLKNKVQIFEYQNKVLHSKMSLVDECVSVGSANLNFRSFVRDVEINMNFLDTNSVSVIEGQFLKDLKNSQPVLTVKKFSFLKYLVVKFFYLFRRSF